MFLQNLAQLGLIWGSSKELLSAFKPFDFMCTRTKTQKWTIRFELNQLKMHISFLQMPSSDRCDHDEEHKSQTGKMIHVKEKKQRVALASAITVHVKC